MRRRFVDRGPVRPDGSAATDPLDGFAVGDAVVLSQLNTRTPIADEAFTIASIGSGTVTLNTAPSAPMVAAAAAQYGCVLRFADWATATARQRTFLFTADAAAQDLGSGDPPKRWAS